MNKLLFILLLIPISASAQLSNAETIAAIGGRILGAAKACGIDGNRLSRTGEKLFSVVRARAKSERENGSAITMFPTTYNAGIDEVSSGRTSCNQASDALNSLERQISGR